MIYYFAMIINLFLRLTWVFSISPDIVDKIGVNRDIFSLIIALAEMFRRCIWNFFRVEKQHIHNQ